METHDNRQHDDQNYEEDVILEVLSHPVREATVHLLNGKEGEGLQLLAIEITRREAERRGSSVIDIGFDQMQTDIETTPIPLLEDAGLIHYNPETEWLELDGAPVEYHDHLIDD